MNPGLLHLTQFRLRLRASKPPSPPQGGGEGSCGGRFMERPDLQKMDVSWGHEPGLLHVTRFRLRLRASKPPSRPPGGGEGSCGGRFMERPDLQKMDVSWGHEPGLLHLTRFRLRLRASKPPSPRMAAERAPAEGGSWRGQTSKKWT